MKPESRLNTDRQKVVSRKKGRKRRYKPVLKK